MLEIKSHGPLILSTNYWDSPFAAKGEYIVSLNGGAFRVLLPPQWEGFIEDMQAAKGCAVSRGPWPDRGLPDAFEILFDDTTSDPFALHCEARTFITAPLPEDVAKEWILSVWTQPRRGKPRMVMERPCRYRLSPAIPDLRPWNQP